MNAETFVDLLENMPKQDWTNTLNFKAIRVIRDELTEAGMDWKYRDIFVARMNVDINELEGKITGEQMSRLLPAIRALVRKFYTHLSREGFSDEAIAESGHNIKIHYSD